MFLLDDIAFGFGVPVAVAVVRAIVSALRDGEDDAPEGDLPEGPGGVRYETVNACRAAVQPVSGLVPTSVMLGGHVYAGTHPEHVAYLKNYLAVHADAAQGEDARRVKAFAALQGREGSTSSINTYDNQVLTWGTGWSGLGGLPRVMDHLKAESLTTIDTLAACGVHYLGGGQWTVVDDNGSAVTGKKEALQIIRGSRSAGNPVLLALLVRLAEDAATRDPVTDAQLQAFKETSGNIPGSETIATQALFNLVTHMKHWAPGYMSGTVQEAAAAVPGALSAERDKQLARHIVEGFYARAHGWVPSWPQMQKYVLKDMAADGLDVNGDPVLTAAAPPASAQKTVAGCGTTGAAAFKTVGGDGRYDDPYEVYANDPYADLDAIDDLEHVKTVGGCGSGPYADVNDPENCGNWGHFEDAYRHTYEPTPRPVKIVGGPGRTWSPPRERGLEHGHGWRPDYRPHPPQHPWYGSHGGPYNALAVVPSDVHDDAPPMCLAVTVNPDGTLSCAGGWPQVPVVGATPLAVGGVFDLAGRQLGVAQVTSQGYSVVPPGYEGAYEVRDEPDVRPPPNTVAVGGPGFPQVMWGEVQNGGAQMENSATTPWLFRKTVGGSGVDIPAIVQRGIVAAVQAGEHDPPVWVQIKLGEYDLVVTAEPIAVRGIRLPTSLDDAVAVGALLGALPITPAISAARWASRDPQVHRVAAVPLSGSDAPSGALYDDPGQVAAYNARMGVNTGALTDGYWKEIVVVPGLAQDGPHSMAQYGFRKGVADGAAMYEHGGPSNHNRQYKDYSDTPTYVGRSALKNGVPVDVLDEYAAGGALTAALEPWLVERMRNAGGGVS